MATLIKRRARKLLDAGPALVSLCNYAIPGLLTNKHVALSVGDHVMRIDMVDLDRVIAEMQQYRDQLKEML